LNHQLCDELLRRAERDQEARGDSHPDPEAMARVDAENLPWLRQMIVDYGWPTRSMVGERASHAAWLLVQHADRDPVFQRRCLALLTAAEDGEVSPRDVAYLTDRVLLAEGQPQEYGTQVVGRNGRWVPRELRAPETVDERRASMGLEPLVEYLSLFEDMEGPGTMSCPECGTPIRFWLPDPGKQAVVTCSACGWTSTLDIGSLG
jgi:hypothetical protein